MKHSQQQTLLNCAEGMVYLLHRSTDGRKGLGESSRGNEYRKEIDDLKKLEGDQALAIDALKKVDQGGDNHDY